MNYQNYQVNKNTPVPLYYQFKNIILKELNSSQPDDALPPEEVFCNMFGISRSTVRQAILELVNEGYLYRIKSKGTFVARPKIKSDLIDLYSGYNIEIQGLNMTPALKVINMEFISPDRNIAQKLQIENTETARVLSILRYQYADTQIMAHIQSYLKSPLCDFVTEEKLNTCPLYQVLGQNDSTKIKRIERTIETCYANPSEVKLMNMDKGGLVNLCANIGFTAKNEPIWYEILKYRGDKVKYTIEINLD
ncbi:GntR family transcriptional regulator [Desulfosporosinus fructosivorans]|uniref:GntR family transcriptional regulator n=1 Tax=Desulfosporosinus fructosivorans TaxID=2018669 RepID=UPI00130EBAFC|nr:GntR family transcriptional regulator [Desulfosporosinus fructosivorans]